MQKKYSKHQFTSHININKTTQTHTNQPSCCDILGHEASAGGNAADSVSLS